MNKTEWNGTGLPPVGTVCELDCSGSYQGQVEVLFINKDVAVCRNLEDGRTQWGSINFVYRFRPIRTPEQIAAEEREKAIEELTAGYLHSDVLKQWAERAYDELGYRKVTP